MRFLDIVLQHTPFLAMATTGAPKISGVRLIEALIIAVVTAAGTSFATVWRLEERLVAQQRQIERLERNDLEQDRKLYEHEGRLNRQRNEIDRFAH